MAIFLAVASLMPAPPPVTTATLPRISSVIRYLPGSRSTARETRLPQERRTGRSRQPRLFQVPFEMRPTQALATPSNPNETQTSSLSEDRDWSITVRSPPPRW